MAVGEPGFRWNGSRSTESGVVVLERLKGVMRSSLTTTCTGCSSSRIWIGSYRLEGAYGEFLQMGAASWTADE